MNFLKRLTGSPLFKASLIYTITDAVNKAIPFFILPLLSHYLIPSDYGIVANFGVLTGILNILILLSVDGAIAVNYNRLTNVELKAYVVNAILLSLASFAIVTIGFGVSRSLIFELLQIPSQYQLLCIGMGLMNVLTSVNLILFRLEDKPLQFGLYGITQTFLNISLSLFFIVILGQNWVGRINGIAIACIVYGLVSLGYLIKHGYLIQGFKKKYFLDALWFGVPLIPHALSFWIRSGIDRIFITKFWGAESVGLYATGFQFGLLISFLVMAFNNAFSPYIYRSLSVLDIDILSENKYKLVRLTYVIMLGLLLCGVIFIGFSKYIVVHLFAKEYIGAVEYVNWAIVSQVFQGFYVLFVNYIFFVKKTKQLALITISCAIVQIILSYYLVQKIGPIGGAYSTVIVSFLNFLVVLTYSMRVYDMPWFKLRVIREK